MKGWGSFISGDLVIESKKHSKPEQGKARLKRAGVVLVIAFAIIGVGLIPGTHRLVQRAHAERVNNIAPAVDGRQALESYRQLPMRFEINTGQTDAQVNFLARGGGYTLFLTPEGAVLALRDQPRGAVKIGEEGKGAANRELGSERESVLRMGLVGANRHAHATGIEEQAGK